MPDPMWLDTNAVAHAVNGDKVLENEIAQIAQEGHQLLLTPAANNELLNGNPLTMKKGKPVSAQVPSAETRVAIEAFKKRLGITVDMEAAKIGGGRKVTLPNGKTVDEGMATRVGYAVQDHVKRPKNMALPNSLDNISESDSLVLSQVKAGAQARGVKNPVIFTAERKGLPQQAKLYGVTARLPKSPPSGGPTIPKAIVVPPTGAVSRIVASQSFKLIGLGLVQMALAIVGAYVWKRAAESFFKERMEELQPKIEAQIKDHSGKIASLMSQGKKAYANVTIRVRNYTDYVNGTGETVQGFPTAHLVGVSVSAENINLKQGTENTYGLGASVSEQQYTYSSEVMISEEMVHLFKSLMQDYDAASTRAASNSLAAKDLEAVRSKILSVFGAAAAYDVLDASMWPTFKYKGEPIKE